VTLSFYVLSNSASVTQQYQISQWTDKAGELLKNQNLNKYYLKRIALAALTLALSVFVRSIGTLHSGVRASEKIHADLLDGVFGSGLGFFGRTPAGQILGRFGREMEVIDRNLPDQLGWVVTCFLSMSLSVLAIGTAVSYRLFLPITLLAFLYGRIMSVFRPASRDLKQTESISRSPIISHFKELLQLKSVINSNPRTLPPKWNEEHQALTTTSLGAFCTLKALDRWLSVRLEIMGNVIVFAAAITASILSRAGNGKVTSGKAGWGITQALAITGLLNWAVRCVTESETQMMSLRRVNEINDAANGSTKEMVSPGESNGHLVPETDKLLIASGWPWMGEINVKNITLRYDEGSPPVLSNFSLSISGGKKVGIVGRTGSGKSSLFLALFRLLELGENEGSIEIDGVDVGSVSLTTLRNVISIIPQDPVLFSGSIRDNLSPSAEGEELLSTISLLSTTLCDKISRLPFGIDTDVTDVGLSSGERQLLCIARAVLKKSKIILMDEAFSSIDEITSKGLSDTFGSAGTTVVSIAHRIGSVMNGDEVAVFGEGGVLLEKGEPMELMKVEGGAFRRLVEGEI